MKKPTSRVIEYDPRFLEFEEKAGVNVTQAATVLGITAVHYGNMRRGKAEVQQAFLHSLEAHTMLPRPALQALVAARLNKPE